jgi:methylenetetrahydrofolate dehydrogenase (NADP+) / methenyltetrahydrofolate cyclohydrolase
MTLVDGRAIASSVLDEVKMKIEESGRKLSLRVLACEPNFETLRYLNMKQGKAEALGINVSIELLPAETTTETMLEAVKLAALEADGVLVQLPLPGQIDTEAILSAVPADKDVDAFGYRFGLTQVLPPVVGAIDEISKLHELVWKDKFVVIFGHGRLVGAPAAAYARAAGANLTVVTEETPDPSSVTKTADIIILGVGQPNLLTKDMVKEGVVVFDAGASEDGGLLVGDADPAVAEKASIFTPVPGGIGPITVALLFKNLCQLADLA